MIQFVLFWNQARSKAKKGSFPAHDFRQSSQSSGKRYLLNKVYIIVVGSHEEHLAVTVSDLSTEAWTPTFRLLKEFQELSNTYYVWRRTIRYTQRRSVLYECELTKKRSELEENKRG